MIWNELTLGKYPNLDSWADLRLSDLEPNKAQKYPNFDSRADLRLVNWNESTLGNYPNLDSWADLRLSDLERIEPQKYPNLEKSADLRVMNCNESTLGKYSNLDSWADLRIVNWNESILRNEKVPKFGEVGRLTTHNLERNSPITVFAPKGRKTICDIANLSVLNYRNQT